MGIESEIGCIGCKKNIWLGSLKPAKWNGFQISNKDVFRFLSLHSNNKDKNCILKFTLDNCEEEPPWDEGNDIKKEWQEDINSRSTWNSYSVEGKICGSYSCQKLLINKEGKEVSSIVKKNSRSWFCNEKCFEDYRKFKRDNWGERIYDSTQDVGVESNLENLEIGCTQCQLFTIIDGQADKSGVTKNYKYFHSFLSNHPFHKDLIVFTGNEISNKPPWKNETTKGSWNEYKEWKWRNTAHNKA